MDGTNQENLRISAAPLTDPSVFFKPPKLNGNQQDHEYPNSEITIVPMQFRLNVEIHSIDTNNKGKGNENSRDDGKESHYLVGALIIQGVIQFHAIGKQFAMEM
jgi:hypothetical protein